MPDPTPVRAVGGGAAFVFATTAVAALAAGRWLDAGVFLAIAASGAVVAVGSIRLEDSDLGRGRTSRSRALRWVAARVCRLSVRECGCVYDGSYHSRPPESSWRERETVWERQQAGARIHFRRKRVGLKRCHRCGKHYHDRENLNGKADTRTCWPEDEPDVRAKLDSEVVPEEAA